MKIEVGKFYKTRDGRKARIYRTDAPGTHPCHGATASGNHELLGSWALDGWYFSQQVESSFDLVSEWQDPKPRLLAWRALGGDKVGLVVMSVAKPWPWDPSDFERVPHLDEPEAK